MTVSCATDVAAPSSSVRAGRAGRYRSIEIGPNTVSRSSSVGSEPAERGRAVSGLIGHVTSLPAPRGIGGSPWRGVYRQGTPHPDAATYDVDMDNRAEVREFLMSRRAKLTPDAAGMPAGPNRRVAGLRRTEVATLAGVSVEYYAKLERGAIAGASASVLDAISRALQLDDTERAHLFDLARAADGIPSSGRPRRRAAKAAAPRPSLQWAMSAITDGVAFVRDQHQDLLATNELGRAFYSPLIGDGGRTPNLARFQFLDPASREFYPDWDLIAEMCVAIMRSEAGRDPHDKGLQDLVGELSTRSDDLPTPVGRPRRAHPRGRNEAVPPSRRRRRHPRLRRTRHHRRARPGAADLHRRTRITLGRAAPAPRVVGRRPPRRGSPVAPTSG